MSAAEALRNLHIGSSTVLPTPNEIAAEYPLSDRAADTVMTARTELHDILNGRDNRIFIVLGPCSIHDSKAALEYAERLVQLKAELADTFVLVMRVYFEKPRTTVGWKGFINDPFLDDSFRIEEGLKRARSLLLKINELGMPVGTEALDPITPQYLDELITWSAIGARTVESQTHREMASGLSSPVGFKNGTDGNMDVMINALKSVSSAHNFLGIDKDGRCSVYKTTGNQYGHAVLRGGKTPNYDSVSVKLCEEALANAGLPANIMIDCSHGNSNKKPELQPLVFENCIQQIANGSKSIKGLMLESNLFAGNQPLNGPLSTLKYGVSVTDACIDWETTAKALQAGAEALGSRR